MGVFPRDTGIENKGNIWVKTADYSYHHKGLPKSVFQTH